MYIDMTTQTETTMTRQAFFKLFKHEIDAIEFESLVLKSTPEEYCPDLWLKVKEGGELTALESIEYYKSMGDQFEGVDND